MSSFPIKLSLDPTRPSSINSVLSDAVRPSVDLNGDFDVVRDHEDDEDWGKSPLLTTKPGPPIVTPRCRGIVVVALSGVCAWLRNPLCGC